MLQSLSIGMSALAAAQRGIDTTSHNIANANTVGYSRQRIEQAAAFPVVGARPYRSGPIGAGVEVTAVRRMRDEILEHAILDAAGRRGAAEEIAQALNSIQDVTGTLEDGLSTDLSRLWSAWNDVALNPASSAGRGAAIDAASRVAASLRSASARIDDVSSDAVQRMHQMAGEITDLAAQIADLNGAISQVANAGGNANDFMDQRDVAVQRLVALTGAQVRTHDNMVDVTVGGVALVSRNVASAMTVDESPVGVRVNGTAAPMAGAIGGLQTLATSTVGDLQDRLDLIATGLRDAMNAQHALGTDLNGDAGGPIFLGANARELHVDPALTATKIAATRAPETGGGNNALEIARIGDRDVIGTIDAPGTPSRTPVDAVAELVAEIGRRAVAATNEAKAVSAVTDALESRRQEVSGVSIDEELTNMLRYQRAYQAAARIITASDEMLDLLVNRLGIVGR